ncbi:MAG: family 16 glycoside hydrolase [Ferruginibacter sp.]
MSYIKKFLFTTVIYCCGTFNLAAQQLSAPVKKNIVLSAIKGTWSKPGTIMVPLKTGVAMMKNITLSIGDTASFKIQSFTNTGNHIGKLIVLFTPAPDFTGITTATLQVKNSSGKPVTEIYLTGLSTNGLEGENEAPLSKVIDALGYEINIGWTNLANNTHPALQGEEIQSSLFRKAGIGKIEMIPVARYSPDFELPFGFYTNTISGPAKNEIAVLAKAGKYPEHQTLFPAIASGSHSFDPGNAIFGFYSTSPSHTAWSEDVWNMLMYPGHAVHATRIYPVKDTKGILMKATYLVCFEEAKNGDYNDYVFLVKNIIPVTNNLFTTIFNGKDLSGWHTFLKDIGTNKDPGHNFRIAGGMLRVEGKDLGYAITEKAYNNYHFKVDFKWGEKRWPPRENAKRDAGICYNIPLNEPDSIWPKSIECQVQEGDTGDFWLLGFSTIKVNGQQNIPMNHARVIKNKDAEKPSGEWNTVEVISYNGKCIHIVNGEVVNTGEEASVKNGRILLQSEYSEVYYKNIKIRQL